MRGRRALLAGMLAVLAGCANPGFSGQVDAGKYLSPTVHASMPQRSGTYLGVYEPGVPRTFGLVDHFASAVGRPPNLVLYYSNWGTPFSISFADTALAHGAVPVVQIDPGRTSIAAIAAGRYDSYLRSFASAVREFGRPVVIGFAREMNGWWYPWGISYVPPVTWISAWRHLVTLFRRSGACNVTWQWTINNLETGVQPPQKWWPGADYVTWIGIDGYYWTNENNFANVFEPTITAVRKFASKPIVISETGISPAADPAAQIPALFAGIQVHHLLGLVWFDAPSKEDWRLENNPSALATFRREVTSIAVSGHAG